MATPAEGALWELLKDRRLDGWKFRRQHQFGPFILDFYCAACRLSIELDGAGHWTDQGRLSNEGRTLFLEEIGIQVLRLRNDEVLQHTEASLQKILAAIATDRWGRYWGTTPPGKVEVWIDEGFWASSPFSSQGLGFEGAGDEQRRAPSPRWGKTQVDWVLGGWSRQSGRAGTDGRGPG